MESVADDAAASRFAGDVAVVTGVAPNSIAAQVVNGLLAGGATVIATSHSFRASVKAWAKQTYREHATGEAKLWLVPANLSSYRDVDALVEWIGNVQKKTTGATTTILKPAYQPDLFFPFAAPPVHGSLADAGELFESQARLMLWGRGARDRRPVRHRRGHRRGAQAARHPAGLAEPRHLRRRRRVRRGQERL